MTELFMHTITGSTATKEEWIESYSIEELEWRDKTAEECFEEDLYNTLMPIQSSSY